jgi:hypothetical protein
LIDLAVRDRTGPVCAQQSDRGITEVATTFVGVRLSSGGDAHSLSLQEIGTSTASAGAAALDRIDP